MIGGIEVNETAINKFIGRYKPGQFIYPQAIQRLLSLDNATINNILDSLVKSGKAVELLEVSCPFCGRGTCDLFHSLSEIPQEIYCDNCNRTIPDVLANTSTLYRMI